MSFKPHIQSGEKVWTIIFTRKGMKNFKVSHCANIGTRLELMPQVVREKNLYKMIISQFQNNLRDHPLKVWEFSYCSRTIAWNEVERRPSFLSLLWASECAHRRAFFLSVTIYYLFVFFKDNYRYRTIIGKCLLRKFHYFRWKNKERR